MLEGRVPNISDLASLTCAERVIKESMRLYPPAWGVARQVIEDFELCGYRIPAGANVVMSQWVMHRDSRFFSDPEKFDPNRWTTEQCQKLPKFAYFPFGGGPRQCIGASFAMMEAVLLLATIARRFQLHPVAESSGRTSAELHPTTEGRHSRGFGGKNPASCGRPSYVAKTALISASSITSPASSCSGRPRPRHRSP